MRRLALPALLLLGAATPPPPVAGRTPGQDVLQVYQEFCLTRFPRLEQLKQGVAMHKLALASPAAAADALQGRHGKAWTINTEAGGHFTIGIYTAPVLGCIVTGAAPDDDDVRKFFNIDVQGLAAAAGYGKMDFPPLKQIDAGGHKVTLQFIGTLGDKQRQAFVNAAVVGENGLPQIRLSREFAAAADAK